MCGIFSCGISWGDTIDLACNPAQPVTVTSYSRPARRPAIACRRRCRRTAGLFSDCLIKRSRHAMRPRRARAGSRRTRRRRAAQCDRRTPRALYSLPSTAARQRSRMRVAALLESLPRQRVATGSFAFSHRFHAAERDQSVFWSGSSVCANGSSLAQAGLLNTHGYLGTPVFQDHRPDRSSPRSSGRSPRSCADR